MPNESVSFQTALYGGRPNAECHRCVRKAAADRTLLKNEKNPPVFRPFQCCCGLVFPPTAGFTAPDAGSRRQPDISAIGGQRRFTPARLCLLGVFVCRIDAAFPAQYCGGGICRQSGGIMGGLRPGLAGYRPLDSRGIRLSAALLAVVAASLPVLLALFAVLKRTPAWR